jgi:hypothetical protein
MHTVIVSIFHKPLAVLAVTVEDSPAAMLMVQYRERIVTESHASQSVNRPATVARVGAGCPRLN